MTHRESQAHVHAAEIALACELLSIVASIYKPFLAIEVRFIYSLLASIISEVLTWGFLPNLPFAIPPRA